ncbi:hypothetical protein KUTeg_024878 [Tegillarca granosa]|uniref:Uncharacterized protein n=1 Tax=Tegillarca granosa TaxID=220873 RepID=A0ABQ9E438_TEGGR|nr:hypothetical protein KUTeg_024878 [Tegillarca granosa]
MNSKTSPSKPKNPRLYNSSLSLSRAFTQVDFKSKSLSTEGLHRWPTSVGHGSRRKETPKKAKAYERLPLILPKLEPDVNLDLDVETRDESAIVKPSPEKDIILENGLDSEFEERPESEDNDDDYFNFDDDTATARKKLETLGSFEMEHNWILQEDLRQKQEDILIHSKKVRISIPDEDPMATIQNRIEELQTMSKPRAEFANFIETLSPEQKDRIMKIADMDVQTLRRQKRSQWNARDKFRHAFCILCIVIRACLPRRRYFKDDKPDTAISLKRLRKNDQTNKELDRSRSSLSLEMELALSTHSDYRTENDIKKPEELEMSWQREHHFVSRGQTEVLILDRDDYMRLQNKSQGPPVDFISDDWFVSVTKEDEGIEQQQYIFTRVEQGTDNPSRSGSRMDIPNDDHNGYQGLEHLEKPLASEGQGVSLQREYMSPDEAKKVLYTKETWNQYKSVLMRRLVDNIETRS